MKSDRFEVFTSLLIAFVTICAALTAWRANVAAMETGDADFDGLSASIQAQEARIVNSLRAYEHYRAYTTYYRYNTLGDLILPEVDPAGREQSEYWGVALGLQYSFFPSRYLDREGNYDVQREIDELWAESNALADLNAELHFSTGDTYRNKGYYLTGTLIVFAVAFLLLTLAQVIRNMMKYLFALGGVLTMLSGVLLALIFEFG